MYRHARLAVVLLILCSVAHRGGAQSPAPGFRLWSPLSSRNAVLVDTFGAHVHTWQTNHLPGLGVYLLEDGTLLRGIHTGPQSARLYGGGVQMLDLNGTVIWDYRYNGPGVFSHHDIEPMPGGTVLITAWEQKTRQEAIAFGRNPALISESFQPDHIIEVLPTGPTTGTIVWEWHVWDHLIQDFDPAAANYGVVADHPELIDINYPPLARLAADFNHTNAVDYDPVHDWIILSARSQDEVWIIDHSTTTAEAAGHTGGNYGVGGDLLYRWGNPAAYGRGTVAQQQLFNQHSANIIPTQYPGAGNILLFNNNPPGGSAALELVLPLDPAGRFILPPGGTFGPSGPVWSHSGGFQSTTLSSARRLPNGNTLICSGQEGRVFEVTSSGQQVWTRSVGQHVFHANYVEHFLWSDRSTLSLATGGTAGFDLIAGSEHAGNAYLVLGSASGTSPGTRLNGQLLPLNVDAYFFATLSTPGVPPFVQTFGTLDALGRATASFALPPGLGVLAGLHLDHAYVAIDPTSRLVTRASNAVPLDLVR